MPAMLTANECCYKRTLRLKGLEALNHRSELKILWDTFRSQNFGFHMIAGSQMIADDRRRSEKIEHGSIFCDRLRSRSQDRRRSQKCVSIWSQTIAELSAICDLRSAIPASNKHGGRCQSDQPFIWQSCCRQRALSPGTFLYCRVNVLAWYDIIASNEEVRFLFEPVSHYLELMKIVPHVYFRIIA